MLNGQIFLKQDVLYKYNGMLNKFACNLKPHLCTMVSVLSINSQHRGPSGLVTYLHIH
jgi:hypothetical protein